MPNIFSSSKAALSALLGIAAFQQGKPNGTPIATADEIRESFGGNISPLPTTRTRFFLADLESATRIADSGNLSSAAQLYRAMRRDGVISGLLSSCTDGLVRLPKRFYGSPEQIARLEPRNGSASVFDEMFPPSELALLAADGRVMGVGVAELLPVEGRDYPVMQRLDPEWLQYRWVENRWYYNSIAGPLPITPGDGRWVLHIPGGRNAPWQSGLWQALGRAWINKEHALLHRSNFSAKLANPARVAFTAAGASEPERRGFLSRLIAWGVNTVFELPPGWDVKLIESNGRGFEVFQAEIESSDNEFMIALAGQVVTTTGGTGFANADIHRSIRSDIIKSIADSLAYTINTQCIPPWAIQHFGAQSLDERAIVEWDVEPAKDRTAEATTLVTVANAIGLLREQLSAYGRDVDIVELANRFGLPIAGDANGDGTPDNEQRSVPALVEAPAQSQPSEDAIESDAAAALAQKMTEHKIDRCVHGSLNRCRLCGIERVRDFDLDGDGKPDVDENGQPKWVVAWKPIAKAVGE